MSGHKHHELSRTSRSTRSHFSHSGLGVLPRTGRLLLVLLFQNQFAFTFLFSLLGPWTKAQKIHDWGQREQNLPASQFLHGKQLLNPFCWSMNVASLQDEQEVPLVWVQSVFTRLPGESKSSCHPGALRGTEPAAQNWWSYQGDMWDSRTFQPDTLTDDTAVRNSQ